MPMCALFIRISRLSMARNAITAARSVVPYREQNPEIARAVRKATEAPAKDEAEAVPEEETPAQDQPQDEA